MKPPTLSTFLFLFSILFHWLPTSFQLFARGRFYKQARFVMDSLHQLTTIPRTGWVYNVSDAIDCTFKCIEHDQCWSFNIAVNSTGGLKLCQLYSTDKYTSSSYAKKREGSAAFIYYHIDVGLKQGVLNPCKNGGTLHLFYWTGNYQCECPQNSVGKHCDWIKLNSNPVHVESKGDKFGAFKASSSGQILRFKLVYISGGMSCWITEPRYEITKLGCGSNIAMYITDQSNQVVSPGPDRVNSWMGYSLPGYTSNDTEIILPEIDPPLQVSAEQELRLWYGEDLANSYEDDNVGTLDVDVFALYN